MRKTTTAAAALAAAALLAASASASASTTPDHQDAPVIERGYRDLRDVPIIAGALEQDEPSAIRIAGADRYETAALISENAWQPEQVGVVFLASGEQFPDALALGGSFGGVGPILLTHQGMPYPTLMELQRLRPCVVVVVGGENRVPSYVLEEAGWQANPNQAKCNA